MVYYIHVKTKRTKITKVTLQSLYYKRGLSLAEIATTLNLSVNTISYRMHKFGIKRRSISQAIYLKHNPNGDPFSIKPIKSMEDAKLLGLGLGLYWGEGNKANEHSLRLGNTDPELIKVFIMFLTRLFGVKKT